MLLQLLVTDLLQALLCWLMLSLFRLQVFQKIQGRINKGLTKYTAQELEQRLAQQYQAYLHTLNTKAGVFRDTIIESDYNPLEPRCLGLHTEV